MKIIVVRFQCTSEVNVHWMRFDLVHMAQQISRFEKN